MNKDEQFRFFVQRNGVYVEWTRLTEQEAKTMYRITHKQYGPTHVLKLEDDPRETYGYEPQGD